MHGLFEDAARRAPGAVAMEEGSARLTYAELDAKAESFARQLRSAGAVAGCVVCVDARYGVEATAAMLGVWKAGAVYLPMDEGYPPERRRFMLEDSRASFHIGPDGLARPLGGPPRPCPEPRAAYLIYTSGSTGRPKGVAVAHEGAVNYMTAISGVWGLTPADRVLLFSSMGFDSSLEELLPAFSAGATVVVRGMDMSISAHGFARAVEDLKVSVLDLPTAYWHEMAAVLVPQGWRLPPPVRLVVLSGEAVRPASLELWRPSAPACRLLNEYGPTEATVICAVHEVAPDHPADAPVPVGRAVAGAELHLLDDELKPVPEGEPGELYIGGPGVSLGYLDRPELTAERFVPDPFSGRPGARLYRTGDRLRRRPDGVLEYLGRVDHQIKVRGYRVELGEVEAALAAHPSVGTAAVLLREDQPGLQRLVAYLTPRPGQDLDQEAVHRHLKTVLPEPALPGYYMTLPTLPLNHNGKVDRKALPAPPPPETDDERGEAWLAVHTQIMALWEELLGVTPGLHDKFFDLGGHSLLAVRMLARLEKDTGVRPSLSDFFALPTVDSLARSLLKGAAAADGEPLRLGEGDGAPLFFVHGDIQGGGFYCRRLAEGLGRPMVVLPPDPIAEAGPLPTLGALAESRLAALRRVAPRGPYRLGGYCIGGLIAHEMACRLRARGEEVAALVLVDAVPGEAGIDRLRAVADRLGGDDDARLGRFLRWRARLELLEDLLDGESLRELLAERLARKRGRETAPAGAAAARDALGAYTYAAAGHRPGAYDGPLSVLMAAEHSTGVEAVLKAWRPSSPAAAVSVVPGDHITCVTRHAPELAAALRERLA
ncbi:MAG: amino acid adenylation domain-containing protein [Elusimicrobiota bacterium]|nr:amino acid adenylation domain-containing protein [Elusimicrobiota bacterium]